MNRDGVKKIIKIGTFMIVTSIVIVYIYFSFRDYASGPEIFVSEPVNGSLMSTSTVTIKGRAQHIQNITLNNKPLLIDKDGNFSETLLLFPGYNVSVISANDKFKRTTEYKMELVYQDKE